jgi:peroxiredoxin
MTRLRDERRRQGRDRGNARPVCGPDTTFRALKHALVGMSVPDVQLIASPGRPFGLHDLGGGWVVIYLYDGSPEHAEADAIEHRAFGCLEDEFSERAVKVTGLSTQTPREQEALVARERICHLMLADPGLEVARAWKIPLLYSAARTYPRVTLICKRLTITAVLTVSEPAHAGGQVLAWMSLAGVA